MSPEDRVKVAVDQGAAVHPQYRETFETGFSVAWARVPFTLGCAADWTDDARAQHYDNLCAIDGRIALAGEHASYHSRLAGGRDPLRARLRAAPARAGDRRHEGRADLAFWLAGAAAALAQTPFLSKGWTFDEPDGASLYAHVCAACHQADGEGASGAGVLSGAEGRRAARLDGLSLDVLLGGQHAMPALGRAMSDAQLADLVNYVRQTFAGASDDPATPERAAAARAAFKR